VINNGSNPLYKIAVIEDDLLIRNLYKTKLEHNGFIAETARDGVEGLELVQTFKPDLLLLDLKMPYMPGDEMLKLLREHEWGSAIRVIIMTNISRNEAPSVLRFLNVDRYIVKAHYTPSQVIEIVREVLHIRQAN
jgi:DNA-binding response OmpR family regulator